MRILTFSNQFIRLIVLSTFMMGFLYQSNATNLTFIEGNDRLCGNFNISLNGDAPALDFKLSRVVLDAGHGGKDPGCRGHQANEKDIALEIVKKLGDLIIQNHPDVEVIYTREKDEFIPLHERAEIANKSQADLFISVHCNYVGKPEVSGTETYVMGLHRAKDNLEVAKRENSVVLMEENYKHHYEGFDPNSDEGHITLSVYQNAFLDQSIGLAENIENSFSNKIARNSRGVKQAGFLVLRNTVMPSILVEAGFLSNPEEEKYLKSKSGQNQIAESIYFAFKNYKYELEGEKADLAQVSTSTPADVTSTPSHGTSTDIQEGPSVVEIVEAEIERNSEDENAGAVVQSATPQKSKMENLSFEEEKINTEKPETESKQSDEHSVESNMSKEVDLKYVVQVAASDKKLKLGGSNKWSKVDNEIMIRYEKNMYKYQVGYLQSYQEASHKKQELKTLGFNDAFVAAYYNDKPIRIQEALKISP